MTRLITADASKISGRDFLETVFGKRRTPEEQAERERLAREHQTAIQATFSLPLFEGIEERARLNAEFDALVKAGKTEVMIVSLDEHYRSVVERDLLRTVQLQGDAFQARAVAAAQSRRVSPSRPSGLPSLSQRKSA